MDTSSQNSNQDTVVTVKTDKPAVTVTATEVVTESKSTTSGSTVGAGEKSSSSSVSTGVTEKVGTSSSGSSEGSTSSKKQDSKKRKNSSDDESESDGEKKPKSDKKKKLSRDNKLKKNEEESDDDDDELEVKSEKSAKRDAVLNAQKSDPWGWLKARSHAELTKLMDNNRYTKAVLAKMTSVFNAQELSSQVDNPVFRSAYLRSIIYNCAGLEDFKNWKRLYKTSKPDVWAEIKGFKSDMADLFADSGERKGASMVKFFEKSNFGLFPDIFPQETKPKARGRASTKSKAAPKKSSKTKTKSSSKSEKSSVSKNKKRVSDDEEEEEDNHATDSDGTESESE